MDIASGQSAARSAKSAQGLLTVLVVAADWLEREAIARIVEARARVRGLTIQMLVGDNVPPGMNAAVPGVLIRVADQVGPELPTGWHIIDLSSCTHAPLSSVPDWRENPQALLQVVERAVSRAMPFAAAMPRVRLTQRQEDVLALLAEGHSNGQIATALGMSENTVRIHVSAILKALRVSNRTQAALWARQTA